VQGRTEYEERRGCWWASKAGWWTEWI
jgi:hypothetical protein